MEKTKVQLVNASGEVVANVTLPERPDLPDELPRMMTLQDGRNFMRCEQPGQPPSLIYIETTKDTITP